MGSLPWPVCSPPPPLERTPHAAGLSLTLPRAPVPKTVDHARISVSVHEYMNKKVEKAQWKLGRWVRQGVLMPREEV